MSPALAEGSRPSVLIASTCPVASKCESKTGACGSVVDLFAAGGPRDACDVNELVCADPKTLPFGCGCLRGTGGFDLLLPRCVDGLLAARGVAKIHGRASVDGEMAVRIDATDHS